MEPLNICQHCNITYTDFTDKYYPIILNCGHEYCEICSDTFTACPIDNMEITNAMPNYKALYSIIFNNNYDVNKLLNKLLIEVTYYDIWETNIEKENILNININDLWKQLMEFFIIKICCGDTKTEYLMPPYYIELAWQTMLLIPQLTQEINKILNCIIYYNPKSNNLDKNKYIKIYLSLINGSAIFKRNLTWDYLYINSIQLNKFLNGSIILVFNNKLVKDLKISGNPNYQIGYVKLLIYNLTGKFYKELYYLDKKLDDDKTINEILNK